MLTKLTVPWFKTSEISSNTETYTCKLTFVTLRIRSIASKQSLSQMKCVLPSL